MDNDSTELVHVEPAVGEIVEEPIEARGEQEADAAEEGEID
jgi:hypothetical protein